jgi:hypothetical protein
MLPVDVDWFSPSASSSLFLFASTTTPPVLKGRPLNSRKTHRRKAMDSCAHPFMGLLTGLLPNAMSALPHASLTYTPFPWPMTLKMPPIAPASCLPPLAACLPLPATRCLPPASRLLPPASRLPLPAATYCLPLAVSHFPYCWPMTAVRCPFSWINPPNNDDCVRVCHWAPILQIYPTLPPSFLLGIANTLPKEL